MDNGRFSVFVSVFSESFEPRVRTRRSSLETLRLRDSRVKSLLFTVSHFCGNSPTHSHIQAFSLSLLSTLHFSPPRKPQAFSLRKREDSSCCSGVALAWAAGCILWLITMLHSC